MTARIIAISNQKGGVGKTTTTFHLARAAVRAGLRVLMIDADSQGNLTTISAAQGTVADDSVGLADVLTKESREQLTDVIVPTVWDGADLVPTNGIALAAVRDELLLIKIGRESRLKHALVDVGESYDLILIDCAPALDQLTVNVLTAAHAVLIVTHARLLSANGLSQLLDTISEIRRAYNPDLEIAGLVINALESRTIAARTWVEELEAAAAALEIPILTPNVPKRAPIADASEAGKGLDEWAVDDATRLAEIYDEHLTQLTKGTR